MELALAQYTSIEIEKQSSFITSFSDSLETHFRDKWYGSDIKKIAIGIICVSRGFESFAKPKPPKYTKNKKKIEHEGFSHEVEKCLEYDVKLDFEAFKNNTESGRKQQLATDIMNSLSVLDTMKAKIKDFDIEKFKADIENYFISQGLI